MYLCPMKNLSIFIMMLLLAFAGQSCSNSATKSDLETEIKSSPTIETEEDFKKDENTLDSLKKTEKELLDAKKKELGIE